MIAPVWIAGVPPDDVCAAWLRINSVGPDGDSQSVILSVRDDDGWWSVANRWQADDYTDPVVDEITHWMPYLIPSARI